MAHIEAVGEVHLGRLAGNGLGDLVAAVAGIDAP